MKRFRPMAFFICGAPLFLMWVVGAVILVGWASTADADVKEFYRGKRMTILVGFLPGGTFDIQSRWLGRHLPKYTGASVMVQNMPGAGGLIAYNSLYKAPSDGLSLLIAHTRLVAAALQELPGVHYNFDEFVWLGGAAHPSLALMVHRDLPSDLEQLRKVDRIYVGASDPFYEGLFAEALGLHNMTVVAGYGGTTARIAAIRRGELHATVGSTLEALTHSDIVRVAAVVLPDSMMPEAPTIDKLKARQPWGDYLKSFVGLMYSFVTSPKVPDDRARFLENALTKVTEEPDALAEAKRFGFDVQWRGLSEVRSQVKLFTGLSEGQRKQIDEIARVKYVGARK